MKNIDKAVGLTKYFMTLPPARWIAVGILVLGVLLGIGTGINKYSGFDLLLKGSLEGIFLLAAPALLSAVAIKLMLRKMLFRRILAATFIGELVYTITYAGGFFLSAFNPTYAKIMLIVGAAMVFVIWYLIARLVFVLKWRAFIFAIIQLFFHLAFLLSTAFMDFGTEPTSAIIKFYVASFVLLGAIYVILSIINAPMKRNFGFTSTDAISMFTAQWLYQDKKLEGAFEAVGENAKVPIAVFSFERGKDSGNKSNNVMFVIPYVHFGPFGNLGGSEFSALLSDAIGQKYNTQAFVFHGTATHDLNPSSSDEISAVLGACEDCMRGAKYSSCSVSLLNGRKEECFSETLLFNDSAFVSVSRAPQVTEDINFGLDSMLMAESEKKVEMAAVIDQHNAETGEVTSFEPASEVGYKYMEAIKDALEKAGQKTKKNPLSIGTSIKSVKSNFVGNAGVRVAAISSDPISVLILVDSNGVTPEFREKILAEAKAIGAAKKKNIQPILFTTDTHQLNAVRGVLNPLSEADGGITLSAIKEAVGEAIDDMQPAKFYSAKKWFVIKVLGAKQSIEIISTVNSIVAVAKIIVPLLLVISILLIVGLMSGI